MYLKNKNVHPALGKGITGLAGGQDVAAVIIQSRSDPCALLNAAFSSSSLSCWAPASFYLFLFIFLVCLINEEKLSSRGRGRKHSDPHYSAQSVWIFSSFFQPGEFRRLPAFTSFSPFKNAPHAYFHGAHSTGL